MTDEKFSPQVIDAAKRVSCILESGCDRCDLDDLCLLETNGLMYRDIVDNPSDTLNEGDTAWLFSSKGNNLVVSLKGGDS